MSRDGSMHEWFGLSYAGYLTVPRALIQEMPEQWQARLAALLCEVEADFTWPLAKDARVEVRLRAPNGRLLRDPLSEYRHPDAAAIVSARAARAGERTTP